jgi:serine/threonine protein kinase/tetratricopeptide (TPR) repeat protein
MSSDEEATEVLGGPPTDREPFEAETPAILRDRYVLTEVLGRGGLGIVISAWDPELERKVAIKLVRLGGTHGNERAQATDRMLSEARALAQLAHPNVVSVFDVGRYEASDGQDGVFVVMEELAGPTLHAWLRSPHSADEILGMFTQAGEGLAAAHARGLVHRDFKPANVVLDAHGVPKVVDFGLALARDQTIASEDGPSGRASDDGGSDATPRTGRATATGWVMGTPRYMAPEQHAGDVLGPEADQYAFCVALWEALRGHRVFAGDTLEALAQAKRRGDISTGPDKDVTPARLVRVLARGIAAEPGERWPSMRALLAALRPRRRRLSIALVGGLVAVGGLGMAGALARTEPCQAPAGPLDPEVRAEISGRLQDAEVATRRRIETRLDARAGVLADGFEAACRAHQAGTIDALQLDRRVACLYDASTEFAEAITVLTEAEVLEADRAMSVVDALGGSNACDDDQRLAQQLPPPEDAGVEKNVARLRAQMRRVAMLGRAGRRAEADALFDRTETEARAVGYAPLVVEIVEERGLMAVLDGRYAEAEILLEQALVDAQAIGHDRVAAKAAAGLVFVIGVALSRFDEGLQRADVAIALLQRAGDMPLTKARLLSAIGSIKTGQHHFDAAMVDFRAGLEVLRASPDHDVGEESVLLGNLATAMQMDGDLEGAAQTQLEVLAIREELLGPSHPKLAITLFNLANTRSKQRRFDDAEPLYLRAIDIYERDGERSLPRLPYPLNGLGVVYKRQGRYDEAVVLYRRAAEVAEAAYGSEHDLVTTSLRNLANLEKRRGNLEDALELARRAIRGTEARLGDEHPEVATMYTDLGHIQGRMGDDQAARVSYEHAIEIYTAAELQTPDLAAALVGFGNLAYRQGDIAEAGDKFERAEALYEAGHDDDLIYAQYGRGRVALAQGDARGAEPLLRAAVDGFAPRGDSEGTAAEARAHWARALWAIGNEDEARRQSDRALTQLDEGSDVRVELVAWRAAHR